jgi:glycosyltransferase involved in cell wall biosynthesis
MAHALETLLMAARILQERPEGRDVVILFVGDGAAKAQLQRSAAAMGLRNVRFVDTVPKEEIPDYWSLLDVAIVHLRKTPLFETVIPSKIFEAFAMGTPILLGVRGEARQIVEETGSGFAFEPEDHEQLAGRLLQLALDRAALNEAKAGCAAGARRYDRSRLAADMLDVITQIVRGSPEESRQAASKASRQEELEA